MLNYLKISILTVGLILGINSSLLAETEQEKQPNIPSEIIDNSPVLQRWLEKVPNILEEIRRDPNFRTRWRLGYAQFPSNNDISGFNLGVEDLFISQTNFTFSTSYQGAFNGQRKGFAADINYYIFPLGSYINIAPIIGYRYLESTNYSWSGVNIGAKIILALSRNGAADISFSQTFIAPSSDREVGISTISVGYAVTKNLRLSTDLQKQTSRQKQDNRVGIVLEWMP